MMFKGLLDGTKDLTINGIDKSREYAQCIIEAYSTLDIPKANETVQQAIQILCSTGGL